MPRGANLYKQWGELARQPCREVTTNGQQISGLYHLRDKHAPVEAITHSASQLLDTLDSEEHKQAIQIVDSQHWREWQNTEILAEAHGFRLEFLTEKIVRFTNSPDHESGKYKLLSLFIRQ